MDITTTTIPFVENQQGANLLVQGFKELISACVKIGNGISSLTEPLVRQGLSYLSTDLAGLSGLVNLLVDVLLIWIVFILTSKIQKTVVKIAIVVLIGLISFALFTSYTSWFMNLFK